jgi:hypothetical protein
MEGTGSIGIDLAKHVFRLHGLVADGTVLFRRRLGREKLIEFLAAQPARVVAMQACASAHFRAREIRRPGHGVRLIASVDVEPFSSGRRATWPMRSAAPRGPRTPRRAICEVTPHFHQYAPDHALRCRHERGAAGVSDELQGARPSGSPAEQHGQRPLWPNCGVRPHRAEEHCPGRPVGRVDRRQRQQSSGSGARDPAGSSRGNP